MSCYIIAEISANHNGQLSNALEIVRLAAEAGADAVKIQTYTADTMTLDCESEPFIVRGGTLWDGRKLYDLYAEAHTPWDWHQAIFDEAKKHGLDCFSSPFDATAVDFLEQFDPPYHKIASFELTDHPLLEKIASTGRKVILSTGMASLEEIEESVEILKTGGCPEITLLKCTSSYPAPAEEANLSRIADMAGRFGVRAGLSDHTMGFLVPVAAVALGAQVIEKHFCRSRDEPGPIAHSPWSRTSSGKWWTPSVSWKKQSAIPTTPAPPPRRKASASGARSLPRKTSPPGKFSPLETSA